MLQKPFLFLWVHWPLCGWKKIGLEIEETLVSYCEVLSSLHHKSTLHIKSFYTAYLSYNLHHPLRVNIVFRSKQRASACFVRREIGTRTCRPSTQFAIRPSKASSTRASRSCSTRGSRRITSCTSARRTSSVQSQREASRRFVCFR